MEFVLREPGKLILILEVILTAVTLKTAHKPSYWREPRWIWADIRETILHAMAMTGDTDGVRKVLETEQNAEIRVAAIHALAMSDEEGTAEFLSGSYDGKSMEEKMAIIESLMILEDAKGLIRLLNLEEDASLRREMLQRLTIIDSEEANEFLFEMLESRG